MSFKEQFQHRGLWASGITEGTSSSLVLSDVWHGYDRPLSTWSSMTQESALVMSPGSPTPWILTSDCVVTPLRLGCLLRTILEHRCFNSLLLSSSRYFNEMSAQGLRPRTVSSPIPYTPSPSSSRPISPGECNLRYQAVSGGWGLNPGPHTGLASAPHRFSACSSGMFNRQSWLCSLLFCVFQK